MRAAVTDLFSPTPFRSHSGLDLSWKIDCDALSDVDLDTLAQRYAAAIKPAGQVYGEIVGVPRGGLRFAEALRRYVETNGNQWQTHLVVDDVLTTGSSMEAFWRERWPTRFSGVRGIVIFARGACPSWVQPIFTLAPWM